jgi:hypothetical protein
VAPKIESDITLWLIDHSFLSCSVQYMSSFQHEPFGIISILQLADTRIWPQAIALKTTVTLSIESTIQLLYRWSDERSSSIYFRVEVISEFYTGFPI